MKKDASTNAGFWLRTLAAWIDLLVVYVVLKSIFYLAYFLSIYIYFPFQFTFVLVFIVYNTCSIALIGQTAGMWLLNIQVYAKNGGRLTTIKVMVREIILKPISFVVLCLGFLWIGFSRSKKGWHDYLIGSIVVTNDNTAKISRDWKALAILSLVIFAGNYFFEIGNIIYTARKFDSVKKQIDLPFIHRKRTDVVEVSKIANDAAFINWCNKNARSPQDYAIEMAKTHRVTLFGESHEIKENLDFFNGIIHDLYFKAGVRCIGMEVLPALEDGNIEKLMAGKNFDEELALEIARSEPWKTWGDREYWDVLKTVWTLNQGLPANAQKMRLIGLDDDWEMASIVLLNIGGDKRGPTPFAEKFRIFPMIKDLVNMAFRDEMMARTIEREMIQKGDKGVVWIGFAHTVTQFAWSQIKDQKIIAMSPRMGLLLHQKYPNDIFGIEVFQSFDFDDNKQCTPHFQSFIEGVMAKRHNSPAGFSLQNSPFLHLRDSCSGYFSMYPTINYSDLTQGLLFLKPLKDLKHCTWTKRYISNEMFMQYKPLYELLAKRKFRNANQVNDYFTKSYLNDR